jgi:hypothetical protein
MQLLTHSPHKNLFMLIQYFGSSCNRTQSVRLKLETLLLLNQSNSSTHIFTKVMKRLFAVSCSSLLLFGAFSFPATAQSSQCNRTLQAAKSQLTNIQKFQTTKLNSSGQPRPKGRSQELNIIVNSDKIMNNGKIQLTMTKKIVANCSQIGLVTFNQYQTDWVNMYGLLKGKVQAFSCKDLEDRIKWGEYVCL